MPTRTVKFAPNQFYHVYNRGNDKQRIFFEPANYCFFLKKFAKYFPETEAEIHAYCLLPNHYHILIRLKRDIDYSMRMRHFSISYAKSLNKWAGRVGHLFQGRFKAKGVGSTEYLLYLSRYIHLNPVVAGLARAPQGWQYSSYCDYLLGSRNLDPGSSQIPGIYTCPSLLPRGMKQEDSRSLQVDSCKISGIYKRPAVTTDFILWHFASVNDYRSFVESNAGNFTDMMDEELWKAGEFRSLCPQGE
jgi:putative transposase